MLKNEKELNFKQLIYIIDLGEFTIEEKKERIIFLSKGILIAFKEKILFYDYQRFSKTFIKSIDKKDISFIKISKLLDDRFCIYTLNETLIYQFNNEDYTITLLKRINVNLDSLKEIEKDIFINVAGNHIYFWKELKSIYKDDNLFITILNIFFGYILSTFLPNYLGVFIYIIIAFFYAIISFIIIHKYVYLINPYKRFRKNSIYRYEKCGNNLCCIKTFESIYIFNYRNFKIIKEIFPISEQSHFWYFCIINENLILLINNVSRRLAIFDVDQNKIIKNIFTNNIINIYHTTKIENNIFISFDNTKIIKWKYNFELNDIEILNRIYHPNIYPETSNITIEFLGKNIINNKLYVTKIKYEDHFQRNYKIILYCYK